MTKEDWFADHGKIGAGDSGIGEMDSPADAEGIALFRNALPEIIEVLRAAERVVAKLNEYEAAIRAIGIWTPAAPDTKIVYGTRGIIAPALAALESKVPLTVT
jgi:hypothetical protein